MTVQSGATEGKQNAPWTVRRVIDWTTAHLKKQGSETPRLDSEILLAHARRCERIDLYTRFDDVLSDDERRIMRDLVRRRSQAEPVAYLVGHREFFSLEFQVTPDVLIPRPDTETLVVALLELAKSHANPRILDIGTGSGCIAVAATANHPGALVTATDLSGSALDVARENARRNEVADRIRFFHGDLFSPIPGGETFDFVVSNPPYVTESEMKRLQADVRLHEPHSALAAGPDGLDVLRRLIEQSHQHLTPGGYLLVEISSEQGPPLCELVQSQGVYCGFELIRDLAGNARVIRVQRVPVKSARFA